MANADIKLRMTLDDQVSGDLDKVKKSLDKMEPAFKGMAAVGTAAFAAVSAVVYKSVSAANEAAEVQAQLGAVLESTGHAAGLFAEDINEQSKALQKLTTFGDEAITSTANLLLTFTNVKGAVFQEALPAILDMSVALGQDLKSSAIQVGKALNDPIMGVSALRKVGVSLTVQQEEMIKTLVESGKTMDAQRIILAELSKEFGGSASAQAATFSGKLKQLNESVGDLFESIGNTLLPVLETIVDKIGPVVAKITEWVENNPRLTATLIALIGGLGLLTAAVGFLGIALIGLTGVATTMGITLGALFGWIIAIPIAIAAVIAIGVLLYKHWDDVKAKAQELWQNLILIWEGIKESISAAWNAVLEVLTIVWEAIKTVFITAVEFVLGAWAMLLDFLFPGWQQALEGIWQVTLRVFSAVSEFIGSVVAKIVAVVKTSLAAIQEVWNKIWNEVKDAFLAVWAAIKSVAAEVFAFISEGVEKLMAPLQKLIDMANAAYDAAKRVVGSVGNAISGGVSSIVDRGKAIFGKASGGPVSAGTPYIVGEKGPELFIPSNSGSIVPNGAMGAINITITGNSFFGEEDLVDKVGSQLMNILKQSQKIS